MASRRSGIAQAGGPSGLNRGQHGRRRLPGGRSCSEPATAHNAVRAGKEVSQVPSGPARTPLQDRSGTVCRLEASKIGKLAAMTRCRRWQDGGRNSLMAPRTPTHMRRRATLATLAALLLLWARTAAAPQEIELVPVAPESPAAEDQLSDEEFEELLDAALDAALEFFEWSHTG